MSPPRAQVPDLVARAAIGDRAAIVELLEQYRGRLRSMVALRHYEQMTNGDAAAALGLDKSAASKRYTRALLRLKEILAALPGEASESGA